MFRTCWCAVATLGLAASAVAVEVPRPEHPTPDAVRPHWANLNGTWQFRFDPDDLGRKEGWHEPDAPGFDRTIVVPFPWESELSGVHDTEYKGAAWYRRAFTVPAEFPKGHRVWLRFGAVDWRADVWVNGRLVAQHEGGYTPFEADVTDALQATEGKPATIVVRAWDPTDRSLPTGKQVGWYTRTSGIWQTVWLEARPKLFLADFSIRTTIDPPRAQVALQLAGAVPGRSIVSLRSDDSTVKHQADAIVTFEKDTATALGELTIDVDAPKLWSPESPHLYHVTIDVQGPDGTVDSVQTYFGLRTIARGRFGDAPHERVLLNGKPVYLRLALDQSFNPRGIYTAPDDVFLKRDITIAKAMGLNGLRIHIKPDEPRRLYWADVLGLLILEDMPNTWDQNARARASWERTAGAVVTRDRNHPSIVAWVAFNETWGLGRPEAYKNDRDTQNWVGRMVAKVRALDPFRLVEDNSPCNYDHVENTDLNSWHFYIDDHAEAEAHVADVVERTRPGSPFNYCPGRKQGTAPLINSEYGGVSAGGGDRDISWCFRDLTTLLRRQPKIQGYVYTELSDIEWEHNGFVNYDRTPKTFGYDAFVADMTPADLNGADFVGYEGPPARVVRPGETVSVPVFVSHYSRLSGPPKLQWSVAGWDEDGRRVVVAPEETRPASWSAFDVKALEPVVFKAPGGPFVGAVALVLRDENGRRIAANYVNLVVRPDAPRPRVEVRGEREAVIRFEPGDFARRRWSGTARILEGKAHGHGRGFFEYRLALPPALARAKPWRYALRLEAGAKAAREKVDWPSRVNGQDYPQTDVRTWPSTLEVQLNGRAVERLPLPDDPADARGVLSHLKRREHGSHGRVVEVEGELPASVAADLADGKPLVLRLAVPDDAPEAGGLGLFGAETGAYPFDPTLTLVTREPLPSDLGVKPGVSLATGRMADRQSVRIASGEASAPTEWSYTTTDPGPGWNAPGFDDSKWSRGKAGFGTAGTPALRVGTTWSSERIWLRTSVELPKLDPDDALTLRLFHDEDVEVFVNGKSLERGRGFVTSYRETELDEARKALFRPGKNTIAVSCRQTGGGQGVDLGLSLLEGESEAD